MQAINQYREGEGEALDNLINELNTDENREIFNYLLQLNREKVKSVRDYVFKHRQGRALITGHSLGGYLAYVSHVVLDDNVNVSTITFNQPFTGIMGVKDYQKIENFYKRHLEWLGM